MKRLIRNEVSARLRRRIGTSVIMRELWQKAKPRDQWDEKLNAEMIAWLQRCEAAGWTLVAPGQPIHSLLFGET